VRSDIGASSAASSADEPRLKIRHPTLPVFFYRTTSKQNREIFEQTKLPITERVPMVKGRLDAKASTATGYAWIV
jgi:hypothetical protein